MPRRKSNTLTEAELRLMDVLWKRGPSTVAEVAGALPDRPALAYSSVLTILRILEQKGYVRHSKEGRAFIYDPVVGREEARRSAVDHLVSRFFENSPELLVLNVLGSEQIGPEELRRLRKLLEEPE
jgi:predicted transcriptional regulator